MSKKFRKVLAAILAGTMVLGSGIVASADEGSADGKGDLNVVQKSAVFDVVLPVAGDAFNYILNPTDVIGATNHAKYSATASFVPEKTMYFAQKPANGVATYSNVSEPLTAYNLSTMDVMISVKASVATPSGIEIATSEHTGKAGSFTGTPTATPSIYLEVKASDSSAHKEITTTKTECLKATLSNASARYTVTYATASDTYNKELDATGSNAKKTKKYDGVFESYSFMLTGTCNPDGKWEGVKDDQLPKVSVVWTINNPTGASSALSKKTISASANSIDVTGATVTAVKLVKKGTTTEIACAAGTNYTFANGKLSVQAAMLSNNVGGKLKVVLSTGVTEEVTIQ